MATAGIAAAYETGRGGITVRGRAFIEEEQAGGGRRSARKVPSCSPVMQTGLLRLGVHSVLLELQQTPIGRHLAM